MSSSLLAVAPPTLHFLDWLMPDSSGWSHRGHGDGAEELSTSQASFVAGAGVLQLQMDFAVVVAAAVVVYRGI